MITAAELLHVPVEAYLANRQFPRRAFGGHPGRTGGRHPRARLTDEQARQVRNMYAAGKGSYLYLAVKFGVGESTIRDIVKWRSYPAAGGDSSFSAHKT